MGETELDILREQLENFKIDPNKMTTEKLREALTKRYVIQLKLIFYTKRLMEEKGKNEKEVLKKQISLLKGFARCARNEGKLYNRMASRNPVFSEEEIMSEEEAIELIKKCELFENSAKVFSDSAKKQEKELLKFDKTAQFFDNQRSIAVSKMVVSDLRRTIKNNKADSLEEQMSKIVLEEDSIVDTAAKNITIVGLSDRVVDIYKLLRYKQLANRYRRETHSINRNNILRTSSDNSDLLIEAYSKVQHKFIESEKKTKLKLKGKGNK